MTQGGAGAQQLSEEPRPWRRVLGGTFLVLALGLLAVATLVTYGLTKEYGYSPNDDPVQDLTQAGLGHALVALLVAGLAVPGVDLIVRPSRRRRLRLLVGVLVAVFLVLTLGMALGQRSLDARCAGPDRYSTGAC